VAPCGGEEVTVTPVQRRIIDYALINAEVFGYSYNQYYIL